MTTLDQMAWERLHVGMRVRNGLNVDGTIVALNPTPPGVAEDNQLEINWDDGAEEQSFHSWCFDISPIETA